MKLEGRQSAKLFALDQGEKKKAGGKEVHEKRKKIGELETEYALITSHDTIPGLSLSGLKVWMISCIEIENGHELALSDLVCSVISCCGSESLFFQDNLWVPQYCLHTTMQVAISNSTSQFCFSMNSL